MLLSSTFNVLGSCNFKWLRVAETAHPTTIARLIGRSVFGGMVCINFLRGEISTAHSSKLVCAIRQDNFVIALWQGRCDSPRQGAGLSALAPAQRAGAQRLCALARLRHADCIERCRLSGVTRKHLLRLSSSQFDPNPTTGAQGVLQNINPV